MQKYNGYFGPNGDFVNTPNYRISDSNNYTNIIMNCKENMEVLDNWRNTDVLSRNVLSKENYMNSAYYREDDCKRNCPKGKCTCHKVYGSHLNTNCNCSNKEKFYTPKPIFAEAQCSEQCGSVRNCTCSEKGCVCKKH